MSRKRGEKLDDIFKRMKFSSTDFSDMFNVRLKGEALNRFKPLMPLTDSNIGPIKKMEK